MYDAVLVPHQALITITIIIIIINVNLPPFSIVICLVASLVIFHIKIKHSYLLLTRASSSSIWIFIKHDRDSQIESKFVNGFAQSWVALVWWLFLFSNIVNYPRIPFLLMVATAWDKVLWTSNESSIPIPIPYPFPFYTTNALPYSRRHIKPMQILRNRGVHRAGTGISIPSPS